VSDLKTLAWVGLVLAAIMVAALVSAHERHYSKRGVFLLTRRVEALEDLIREDRTI